MSREIHEFAVQIQAVIGGKAMLPLDPVCALAIRRKVAENRAMQFAEIDPTLLLAPFILCAIAFSLVAWVAMLGGSLKFSLWLLLDDPPGYLISLAMALLIVVINVTVFVGMQLAFGPQPWYIVTCYQAILQVFLVMALARCNPIAAFFAAFAHTFFSTLGTVAIIVAFALGCGSAVSGAIQQHEKVAQQNVPGAVSNPYAQD